ncbi:MULTISPECIES: transglycosylase SLT domain-containing protein [Pseudomonas]|uniref:Lytic transglycosylase domain-containing protein n=1 Tax=Pseudomonas nitroreducens TaxID=46680 RepID=A0A6G6J833_PSENT|nr:MULTISPECIES: transglycosylase SLT domain-containing protein [Pseudomonas]MDU4254098.1 transglycosylase SLT domain-containing protein [Pseudomonas sp.]QIE91545.1 lytic transglycosylase domain-containing protein [Pseudomonas nitroreducens]
MRGALFAITLSFASLAAADDFNYDPLIDSVALRYGADRIVFRALVQKESKKSPWVFNVDGEGFWFSTKDQAVNALWALTTAPWLVKIIPEKDAKPIRRFFPTERAAQSFASSYQQSRQMQGFRALQQRADDSKEVLDGQFRVRRIWLLNTDLGIAQISYRFHGKGKGSVQQWLDPAFNLSYAASHLAELKKQYGSDLQAVGYYHSKTKRYRDAYMAKFMPIYQKEKARAGIAVAAK